MGASSLAFRRGGLLINVLGKREQSIFLAFSVEEKQTGQRLLEAFRGVHVAVRRA